MLDIGKSSNEPVPKCYFTHVVLPQYIDTDHPSTKKKPFSSVLANPFTHTLDLILPRRAAQDVQTALAKKLGRQCYAKVHLKLADIISEQFLNGHIKNGGDVLMLSEGRSGIDNTFSLHKGTLRMQLDKATYERTGLVGKPISTFGRKHVRARFAIEIDLLAKAMYPGRKNYNRLVYASRNVLCETMTWLFYDVKNPSLDAPTDSQSPKYRTVPESEPDGRPVYAGSDDDAMEGEEREQSTVSEPIDPTITAPEQSVSQGRVANTTPTPDAPRSRSNMLIHTHQPFIRPLEPTLTHLPGVRIPLFPTTFAPSASADPNAKMQVATDLLEWLSLLSLDSPRVREGDEIDSYLSRYCVPDLSLADSAGSAGSAGSTSSDREIMRQGDGARGETVEDLVKLRWHGLLASEFVMKVLTTVLKTTAGPAAARANGTSLATTSETTKSDTSTWFALRMESFDGKRCTVLRLGDGAAVWEYE